MEVGPYEAQELRLAWERNEVHQQQQGYQLTVTKLGLTPALTFDRRRYLALVPIID
jgi:hypothetical protein